MFDPNPGAGGCGAGSGRGRLAKRLGSPGLAGGASCGPPAPGPKGQPPCGPPGHGLLNGKGTPGGGANGCSGAAIGGTPGGSAPECCGLGNDAPGGESTPGGSAGLCSAPPQAQPPTHAPCGGSPFWAGSPLSILCSSPGSPMFSSCGWQAAAPCKGGGGNAGVRSKRPGDPGVSGAGLAGGPAEASGRLGEGAVHASGLGIGAGAVPLSWHHPRLTGSLCGSVAAGHQPSPGRRAPEGGSARATPRRELGGEWARASAALAWPPGCGIWRMF